CDSMTATGPPLGLSRDGRNGYCIWFRCSSRCGHPDRKSTRLNSSHSQISYAVFCLKKKITPQTHCITNNMRNSGTGAVVPHEQDLDEDIRQVGGRDNA